MAQETHVVFEADSVVGQREQEKHRERKTEYENYTECLYLVAQSCRFFDSMDCSPPGSSVHGISQARILEWVAVPSSRGSS